MGTGKLEDTLGNGGSIGTGVSLERVRQKQDFRGGTVELATST